MFGNHLIGLREGQWAVPVVATPAARPVRTGHALRRVRECSGVGIGMSGPGPRPAGVPVPIDRKGRPA